MQLATERRDPKSTRVPLDDVLIDLSPEGVEEFFAADGVNLGVGGLSMRSAILPDVGSKLTCRFQSPHDGASVNADCEVVWSEVCGENVGEFGLRFTNMTARDQASIEGLVAAWQAELLGEGVNCDVSVADQPAPTRSTARTKGQAVRIQLDGVGPAIEAEEMHRAEDAMVVEQPLPFLRIGTGIAEGGRRGTLQSVDLRVEDDLPRLVLTVWYDDEGAAPKEVEVSEPTLMDTSAPEEEASMGANPVRVVQARPVEVPAHEDITADALEAHDAPVVEREADGSEMGSAPEEERLAEEESLAGFSDEEASIVAELKPNLRGTLKRLKAAARPMAAKLRVWRAALWTKAGPKAVVFAARVRAFAALLWSRARSGVSSWGFSKTKRTTTHAPRRRVQGERGKGKEEASPKKQGGKGRYVLAAVGIVLVLFVAGRLMASSPQVTKAENLPTPTATTNEDPELGDETMDMEPVEVAVTPSSEPGEVPAESPYAQEVTEETDTEARFESGQLSNPRSYSLRMSRSPQGLRGQNTEDGIRVVVVGSNAIDGARRIASADPRVTAASILNHGEEAELRLRFTEGERPAYRIESQSSTLVVSIAD